MTLTCTYANWRVRQLSLWMSSEIRAKLPAMLLLLLWTIPWCNVRFFVGLWLLLIAEKKKKKSTILCLNCDPLRLKKKGECYIFIFIVQPTQPWEYHDDEHCKRSPHKTKCAACPHQLCWIHKNDLFCMEALHTEQRDQHWNWKFINFL